MTTTEHERSRAERSRDEPDPDERGGDGLGADGLGADEHRWDERGRDGDDRARDGDDRARDGDDRAWYGDDRAWYGDHRGRDWDDRARDGDDHGGGQPASCSSRSRRPARIDVVVGLALTVLVAGLDLSSPGTVAASALAVVTGALVRVDIAERRLPNVLVLVVLLGAAAGVVLAVGTGDGVPAAWACLLGLVVLVACVPLVHGGGLGAGDAKLASVGVVAAALASPSAPLVWLLAVALLGGVHGVTAVVVRRRGTSPAGVTIPLGPVLLAGWWLAVVAASTVLDAS
ncbi:prepilin peptidase [Frigoribacterium sp. CFBP 8766]|jgi:Flp pilus assembly protein protease CpaA|uniref:prepilin peptidase n=1 Tax=Frigoribacterium sp. CFBP 8766 TaxID=2775273 RepID=UPI001783F4D0|nr:prepilin peptidase [Frigoribacterium sp. CFBP 8766]MBD8583764.1 prepilin peptidase [Frigoribacterium sp. CFBP 8766]